MEPRTALRELERALPDTAMVSTDIGNICSVSNSYLRWAGIGGGASDWSQLCQLCCLRFNKPRSFFAAMAFGNCGYAFPAAMGAKVGSHFHIRR